MVYPCTCSSVSYPPESSCPSGNCLRVPSITVLPQDSVSGCGATGTVDILAESNLDICETTVNWYLLSYDTAAFEAVTLTTGVLEFTTTNAALVGSSYTFTGRVTCEGSLLSQYFTVNVFIKNLCLGVLCVTEGESCDPCSGECVETPDVELF